MGGHGALTLYLASILDGVKQYRSVSAFSPITNPTKCPWGEKAFKGYLKGGIEEAKERYDATELVSRIPKAPVHILVDYVSVWIFFSFWQGQVFSVILSENLFGGGCLGLVDVSYIGYGR